MFKKKLSCAALLLVLGTSASAFEFQLQQTFGGDHAGENTETNSFPLEPFKFKVSVADLNNDGAADLWVGLDEIWINNGQGDFTKKETLDFNNGDADRSNSSHLILADINDDGNMDAFIKGYFYLNDGKANFKNVDTFNVETFDDFEPFLYTLAFITDSTSYRLPLDFVDLNNDQKLDAITIYLNDFTDVDSYSDPEIIVALNDKEAESPDLDFFLNIFSAQTNVPVDEIPSNKYNFSGSGLSIMFETMTIAGQFATFSDVDQDGDLDAWVALTENGNFMLYFNDGTGHFTESPQKSFFLDMQQDNIKAAMSIATGDIDNDGDLDAWVAMTGNLGEEDLGAFAHVFINDGQGVFSELEQNFTEKLSSTDVHLVDIDNDGDLDALEVNFVRNAEVKQGDFTPKVLKIWLNDGTGHFTDSHKDITGFFGSKIDVADLNKNGRQDIIVGNQVWLNQVNEDNRNLCDWAEKRFPNFFPKRTLDLIFGDWEYRYYPSTRAYIGVDTSQDKIYVLGDIFGGLQEVGSKQEMLNMSKAP